MSGYPLGEPLLLDVRIIQPGDMIRHLEVRGETIANEEGQIIRLFGTTLDITERKQATITLHQLNQELEQRVLERTRQLQRQAECERLLRLIVEQIRRSLDLDEILTSTVDEVWKAFQADRALIFRLNLNSGNVVYKETVCPPYPSIANMGWEEEWFPADCHAHYLQGNPRIVPDVATDSWGACLAEFMQSIGVRSKIVAPILERQEDGSSRVWGLLIVHACSYPRQWQAEEAAFLQRIANQLAIAISQARLYEAVRKKVEELKQLHLLKDDFVSTVSHELRSPMSSIKMAVQMLEISLKRLGIFDSETHQIQRYFKILKDECQREIHLINDLLDLARLETETELPLLVPLDLHVWLPQIVEPFRERAHEQQQSLLINLSSALPTLMTVPTHLERIVTELLHNACEYTPARESITINAEFWKYSIENAELRMQDAGHSQFPTPNSQSFISISVTNTGVEIFESERDRIFDKFYRILNNDPWRHGGTGLGLALVKKLVETLGATIQVQSGDRKTTFTLRFPIEGERAKGEGGGKGAGK